MQDFKTKISYNRTLFKVSFIYDSSLLKVQFRPVSLYFLIIKNVKWIYCQEMNPFVKKKMNISKNYLKITGVKPVLCHLPREH
jgi:hypothetical protein